MQISAAHTLALVTNSQPEPNVPAPGGDYYAPAVGKTGVALLGALRGIISNQIDVGYDAARNDLFGPVDDPSAHGDVADIYSGRVEHGVTDNASAAAHGLNTEHLWPQSLGATNEARDDLHHLMPADIATNGRRGNLPYGEVAHATWTAVSDTDGHAAALGTDAQGHDVFEPRPENRGDIARALLYLYTRYDANRPPKYTNAMFEQEVATYIHWSDQDPPDAVERARNDAIAALQHNRNPYVDHPEYVDAIGAAFSGH